jgi:hypothetical protein
MVTLSNSRKGQTAKEKQKLELLQKQLKEAEKKLAQASTKNIALNIE